MCLQSMTDALVGFAVANRRRANPVFTGAGGGFRRLAHSICQIIRTVLLYNGTRFWKRSNCIFERVAQMKLVVQAINDF
jgi:hypothetical protein